jgi:circadian clock protein KaiC
MDIPHKVAPKARTGIPGLDDILLGGLAHGRVFLLEGSPGTGKTTMALRFLLEGAKNGERGLYVTLSETETELRAAAESHGWNLDGIDIFEVVPPESLLDAEHQQSLLYSSDLELGETIKPIIARVEQSKATRIVLDSLSEIRLLAQSSLRYRRQILALKHYFARHGATVLLLDGIAPRAFAAAITTSPSVPAGHTSFHAWSRPSIAGPSRAPAWAAALWAWTACWAVASSKAPAR